MNPNVQKPQRWVDDLFRYGGIALLVFFAFRILSLDRCSKVASMRNQAAPFFSSNTLEGAPVRVGPNMDKPLVLEFWASWCGPCRSSMPDLQRFATAHPQYHTVAVNTESDQPRAQIEAARRMLNLHIPVLHDADGQISALYHIEVLPTVVVIGRDARVRYTHTGSFDGAAVEAALQQP